MAPKDRRETKVGQRARRIALENANKKALEETNAAKLKLEQEKAEYERQRNEEVQRILEVKNQLDGGKKELEEEYKKLVKLSEEKPDETDNFNQKLHDLQKREEELSRMESGEGDSLFIKNELVEEDDIVVEDIVTSLEQLRLATGDKGRGKVIAWKPVGSRGKQVITRLGPGKTPRLRIEKASEVNDAWDEETVPKITRPDVRYGEMRNNDGQYIYRYSNLEGIIGVAWVYGDHDEFPEELLKPKDRKKRTENKGQALYPQTQIWLLWKIDGVLKKSWEVRSTIHRLWKKETKGDEVIYYKAKEQENRYRAYLNKERASVEGTPDPLPGGTSPSPTPAPDPLPGGASPSPTPDPKEQSGSNNTVEIKQEKTDNPFENNNEKTDPPVQSRQESPETKTTSADDRDEYMKEWSKQKGFNPDELTGDQLDMFIKAWRLEARSRQLG